MTRVQSAAAFFRDLPIRRKLQIFFIVTTGTALSLAGLGIVVADSLMFYNHLRLDLAATAKILGSNSVGALAFNDNVAATETLSSLRARSHVEIACLYQGTGTLLSKYSRQNFQKPCPPYHGEEIAYNGGSIVVASPIRLADKQIGALVLSYDLGEIYERLGLYGGTVLLSLLVACVITFRLSSGLRNSIAQPVLDLASIARSVTTSRDYGVRAQKRSEDEFGSLADALNRMMEAIESRDAELRAALEAQHVALDSLAQVNSRLKRSNTELERSNSDLERFAFMASHDLQEPLRMITLYAQLLVADSTREAAKRSQYVSYIVGGTKRMRELLADLLSYTEIAGAAEQPAGVVDLNLLVQQVQQTLSLPIEESHAEINVAPMPTLHAHHSRLTSLFQNLIANALKYRGTEPPKIHIWIDEDLDHFTFSVKDNGIGIPPQYHQRIFVAFQRLHGKDIPGTGIGLAICQRVVDCYGGRIWVESEHTMGSTFRFTLPNSMAMR